MNAVEAVELALALPRPAGRLPLGRIRRQHGASRRGRGRCRGPRPRRRPRPLRAARPLKERSYDSPTEPAIWIEGASWRRCETVRASGRQRRSPERRVVRPPRPRRLPAPILAQVLRRHRRGVPRPPVIGICNSWSELVNCNVHLRGLAEAVKRGVSQAGGSRSSFRSCRSGVADEADDDALRNLMAMDVEESIRAYPLDGVVLLTGCDKTNPASILGAASADIPDDRRHRRADAQRLARARDRPCSDCWHYHEELRAGRITSRTGSRSRTPCPASNGHCMTMGTASTMACMTEALGLTLPGGGGDPGRRLAAPALAEAAGLRSSRWSRRTPKPSDILTREAFENAIRVLHAISGSTNAILHLIARRTRRRRAAAAAVRRALRLDAVAGRPQARRAPPDGGLLLRGRAACGDGPDRGPPPPGRHHRLGGLGENIAGAEIVDTEVIRPPPTRSRPGPRRAAGNLPRRRGDEDRRCDSALLEHEGRAIVFEDIHDLAARVDDPDLDCDASSVMVRNAGPVGPRACRSGGTCRSPPSCCAKVTDLPHLDARMSGTSYGAVVLHVAPESAVGGPLALVRDGDLIRSTRPGAASILVDEAELERRRASWSRRHAPTSGDTAAARGPRPAGQRGLRLRLPPRQGACRPGRRHLPLTRVLVTGSWGKVGRALVRGCSRRATTCAPPISGFPRDRPAPGEPADYWQADSPTPPPHTLSRAAVRSSSTPPPSRSRCTTRRTSSSATT